MTKAQYIIWYRTNTLRDFVGEEHYKFCRREFDISRQYLKNCGKPKDWYDLFLIKFHKETCQIFSKYA
jgi:hypothetical protein